MKLPFRPSTVVSTSGNVGAFEHERRQPYVRCNNSTPEHPQMATTPADPIVILSYARTPMGSFQGALAGVAATELGATAVKAAIDRAGISGEQVDKVFMGNVLQAGLGQAPARQAAIGAGLPQSAEAVTVNKVCGSGMQAAIFAHDMLNSGSADVIVAGGMESMTNAPFLLKKHRSGARIGHDTVYDHMMLDGLEDAYEPGRAMGTFAEDAAREYQFTREQQDQFAIESLRRANEAITSGKFDKEIVPVTVATRKGEVTVDRDEQPGKGNPEKIPQLKAAFAKDGTITAATSSSISDGAAALVLTRQSVAEKLGKAPVARVVAHAAHAQAPEKFTSAPVPAIQKVLDKAGWSVGDVDLFEVNEAFACVAMIAMRDIGIPHEKINVNGGATALGHPIGASGARLVTTLIAALQDRGLKRGVASLCIGGGEATALAVELV
jgi:acetyl-CoA C-acetyltransferase